MSHIVTIKTEVRDPPGRRGRMPAARPARADRRRRCALQRRGRWAARDAPRLALPGRLRHRQRRACYDNYGGSWGLQEHLDRFLQRYAVEKAGIEARKRGHSVVEQVLVDGSIKVTINIGGEA